MSKLHLEFVGRVVLTALLLAAGGMLLVTGATYFGAAVCLAAGALLCVRTVVRMNRLNRRIALFFDMCRNRDFSSRFAEMETDPVVGQISRDMNRMLAEQEQEQVRQQEQQGYYERILRVLTHEFRNTLTPLRSLAADMGKPDSRYSAEEMASAFHLMGEQMENLHKLLDAYHRLTHLPEPEMKPFDVSVLLDKLSLLLRAEPGYSQLSFEVRQAWQGRGDIHLLTLVLVNLIRNAFQATAGQLDAWVRVEAGISPKGQFIRVTDNGPGIDPDLLPMIFQPFFTTKADGNGIGLSLAWRIVRLHGGTLGVKSQPGEVTAFYVYLPLAD